MDCSLWNLLHDGSLERIEGTVPGDISLHVAIGYLRRRFADDGDAFVLHLKGCTHLVFQPYDAPETSDPMAIAAHEPEILGAEPGDPLEIRCVMGTLRVRYERAAVALDTGTPVALSELHAAAAAYWRDWSKRARSPQ